MAFYERMQSTASGLLKKYGQGVVEIGRSVPVPGVQDWDAPAITTSYTTINAIVKGVSREYVDGSTVLSTDLMVIADLAGYDPLPGDLMQIDGVSVAVIKQIPIPAAGIIAAWRFIVRA
jgi:hypothetical protein